MSALTTSGSNLSYPGGVAVVGADVKATVTGDNTYDMTFKITATINTEEWSGSQSKFNWKLYETSSTVEGPLVTGCALDDTMLGQGQYSYKDSCKVSESVTGTEDAYLVTQGSEVSAGSSETITITHDDLKFEGVNKNTTEPDNTKHYYLVVEYPESNESQNTDVAKAITISIDGLTEGKATLKS